jgi:hypothetical protein
VARKRVIAAALAAVLLLIWELHIISSVGAFMGDFRAFACAGAALAHGQNPYAAAALYNCERTPMPLGLYHALAGVAVPAPLPGYAIVLFVPFGVLPYLLACALWLLVLLASSILAFVTLARLLHRPLDAAIWALAAGFAVIVIPFGELGSIVFAALLCAGLYVRAGSWTAAAIAVGCAMILPHVALPAVLAAFCFLPRMRVPLIVVAAVLAVVDVLAGGLHTAVSYVTTVLPEHARSEIGSTAQYGLTWILHGVGASDSVAVTGGELSYAVMVLLGVLVAGQMLRRTADTAYVMLIPPAFAMLGGTFVHLTQIMIAIAPALLLYDRSRGPARLALGAAALLLAFPWAWILGQPPLMAVFAIGAAGLAATALDADASVCLRVAFASVLIGGAIVVAGFHFGAGVPAHVHGIAGASQGLAQAGWGEYIRSQRSSSGPVWWIAKAPTWVGLILLPLSCAFVLAKKDFVLPVAVEQVPVTP